MSWPASGQLYHHARWVPGHSGHMLASWRHLLGAESWPVIPADLSLRGGVTGARSYETCPLEARIVWLSYKLNNRHANTPPLAPAPARNKLSDTLFGLTDSSTDQVRLARKASSMTSGDRPGSFDPMLGPWSRGAVCGDRCLPVELAPTPGSEHFLGRAGKPQKSRPGIPPTVFRPAR